MKQETQYHIEDQEWLESFQWVIQHESAERAQEILRLLAGKVAQNEITSFAPVNTPYINTLPPVKGSAYPGDPDIEKKLTAIIRWNAMAMVVRANKKNKGIGGHISTYASGPKLRTC